MKILITGCAGFIGFHLTKKFLSHKNKVFGIDNLNSYYDIRLKNERLNILKKKFKKNFVFKKININNFNNFKKLKNLNFDIIIHLAAQAGVRYSLKNPRSYLNNNLTGFFNILEFAKLKKTKHFLFASTSSVYGNNKNWPFQENDNTSQPLQFYAATKKSNEVMAYSYSNLYKLPITGLRFFTVYGPWGRPDMALFKFTKNIYNGLPIEVYNYGNHLRDFTYIDDIVSGIYKLSKNKSFLQNKKIPFRILNIGNNKPEKLLTYINEIEKNLKIKANKILLPLQKGDVHGTYASIKEIKKIIKFKPKTNIKIGIRNFVRWYLKYYHNKKK